MVVRTRLSAGVCLAGVRSLPTVLEARRLNKVDSLSLRVRDGISAGVSESQRTSYPANANVTKYTQYIDDRQNSRSKPPRRGVLCR